VKAGRLALCAWLFVMAAEPALATHDGGAAPDAVDVQPAADRLDRTGAQRLAKKALAKIKEGAWGEAADWLRQAHDKDPGNAVVTTDLAFALAHLGIRAEAERLYRAAVELDPHRFQAYMNLAELWASDPMRWQRRDELMTFLEKALETLVLDSKAHAHVELRLAELQRSLGRMADARVHLLRLTEPAVPSQVRQRAAHLIEEVDAEARERALDDWPVPVISTEDQARLAKVSAEENGRRALETLDALVAKWPAWVGARWQRARVLERLGRVDDATADLTIVVQLSPSHAEAWRRLGMILTQHGGRLEAEHADEALRHALALEPSWSDLRELRAQLSAKRARGVRKADGESLPEPSARARQLLQDAQTWIAQEAPEMAPPLLRQALADSPSFVEAAVAYYILEHAIPEGTVKALWNDGAALWRMSVQIGAQRTREAADLARPWIDRAVELNVQEARFARASLRAAAGDRGGALEDLRNYVAAEPAPPRLEEARALRVTLAPPSAIDSPERLAHLRLAADRPAEAMAALGGTCRAGLPFDNLLAIGRVYEYTGDTAHALACYQLAAKDATEPARLQRAWERLGAAAAALSVEKLDSVRPGLQAAVKGGVALASLALARMAESAGLWAEAQAELRAFFTRAGADEPRLAEGKALQVRVDNLVAQERLQRREHIRLVVIVAGLAGLLVLSLVLWRLSRHCSLVRALRLRPLLFPALTQAIGQVRHDVLKHRSSALELLSDAATNHEDVARALLEPTPASVEVSAIYQQLAQKARGMGLHLRPIDREPVFGALVRDLAAVEALLTRPDSRNLSQLRVLDQRLHGVHADRLQDLLRAGPRTHLDARVMAHWIDGVASEPGRNPWIAPGLYLQEAQVGFPLDEATLRSIFSNLLRNAVEVTGKEPAGSVQVRVEQGRDSTGRRTVSLVVLDSSALPLREEDIERREADRGLGIVREATRRWGGQIVIRPEADPFRKAVGVRFSAPPEVTP
jgi:tetratricopeptide (TPR) repeat protein